MSLISSLGSIAGNIGMRQPTLTRIDQPQAPTLRPSGPASLPGADTAASFGKLIDAVESKQLESAAAARDVMLGRSDQIHQSVIAMQEASVSLSLMVETRNKLVEGYQELMRMPV
ncbi:flagellar hook-basal body complex protein FliE [Actomonas aquatica]|uniref:Flagellar hook-basal body complex protein FliE n=1 Tax=Actomonas aquatica TaxID=2866162 RepID=A0ABZ1CCJ5_9BACT|nr:flagellar hook-basal body complex protein FliE [Opitutus sp. WL0086]WRQ89284.1 flagellar hook-basal body complex protein FliE [Opitutus sp. WL0086]